MSGRIGYHPNQWIYSQFDRSNSTGHEILLKMGVNSLRLIVCLPGRIGYHSNEFTPILSSILCLVKFDRAWNTAQFGLKFMDLHPIEQYFMPDELGIIPMNLLPFWAVFHAWSNLTGQLNLTGHEILLNLGWNSWIHTQLSSISCPVNWVSFQWIYSHFEQYLMPGRIWPAGRIWPGMKYCSIWVEIHGFTPNWAVFHARWIGYHSNEFTPILSSILCPVKFDRPVEFDQAWNTAQFGLKFMDSHPIEQYFMPGELGIIPMNLLPFWAVFHAWSNSTGQIQPGMKYYSIWVEIHGFTPNLSSISCPVNWVSFQWIYSHFEQYFMPGRIRPGMKYW